MGLVVSECHLYFFANDVLPLALLNYAPWARCSSHYKPRGSIGGDPGDHGEIMFLSLGMSHYLLEDLEKGAAERDVWAFLLGWLTWTWISQRKSVDGEI